MLKDMVFCNLQENLEISLVTPTETGIDTVKTASRKVVQKTANAKGNLIGNKIADKITSAGP